MEKKLDGNYTILNKSRRYHPTKPLLYGLLPPITKIIKVWRIRHAEHYWRRKDELISNVLLWTPSHGRAKAGRPARTYILQLCADRGCSPEDLPEAIDDGEEWRERVRDILTDSVTWWWWCWFKSISRNAKITLMENLWKTLFWHFQKKNLFKWMSSTCVW